LFRLIGFHKTRDRRLIICIHVLELKGYFLESIFVQKSVTALIMFIRS